MPTITYSIKTKAQPTAASGNRMKQVTLNHAVNLLNGINSGIIDASVDVHQSSSDPVAAAGTITITHANVSNGDTTTIANVVITAATSGNGTTSWTIGADATADATALKNCINANTTLNKIVVATSAAGVVTVTSVVKGLIGNGLGLATSDATAFALVAFTGGTGGSNGTPVTYT
jgi:phage tail sheath gpL-like